MRHTSEDLSSSQHNRMPRREQESEYLIVESKERMRPKPPEKMSSIKVRLLKLLIYFSSTDRLRSV